MYVVHSPNRNAWNRLSLHWKIYQTSLHLKQSQLLLSTLTSFSRSRQDMCYHRSQPSHEIQEAVSNSRSGRSVLPHSWQSSLGSCLSKTAETVVLPVEPLLQELTVFVHHFSLRVSAAFFAPALRFSAIWCRCSNHIKTSSFGKSVFCAVSITTGCGGMALYLL